MSEFSRDRRREVEQKVREGEEVIEAMKAKMRTDLADLRLKHQHNMQLINSKFKSQNDLLNDEFIFLSGELQKLRDKEALVSAGRLDKGSLVAKQLEESGRGEGDILMMELRKKHEEVVAKRLALVG